MEPVRVNLATFEYLDRRLSALLALGAASILALVAWLGTTGYLERRETIARYRDRIATLERSVEERRAKAREEISVPDPEEIRRLEARMERVGRLIFLDGFPWIPLLDLLERQLPGEVVMTEVTPSEDFRRLTLKGRAGSTEAMTRFLKRLDQGELFSETELSRLTFVGEGTPPAVRFEITGRLNLDTLLGKPPYRELRRFLPQDGEEGR